MAYVISTIISCLVTGYVFFEIMESVYEKRYANQRYLYALAFILYMLLSCLTVMVRIPLVNTLFSMCSLCVLSYLLYNSSEKNIIINSGIVIIYFAIIDLLVTAVFSTFKYESIYNALSDPRFYLVSGLANALAMLCTSNFLIQLILRCQINRISRALNTYMIFLLFLN